MFDKKDYEKALNGLRELEKEDNLKKISIKEVPQLKADTLNELIQEHLKKETPAKPLNESRQDKFCPVCGAYLSFDALNEPIEEAPNYCSSCGQRIDWSDLNGD